jgi:Phage integrase, N-terminal SAM-like domain
MRDKPISDLRRRMIADMTVRSFSDKTQHDYIRHIETFARFLGRSPDTANGHDIRRFQLAQVEQGAQPPKMNTQASALRFFFTITLGRADLAHQLARTHYPRKLPRVLAREQVARLIEAAPGPGLKYKTALSIAYGAGLRGGEDNGPSARGYAVMGAIVRNPLHSRPLRLRAGNGSSCPKADLASCMEVGWDTRPSPQRTSPEGPGPGATGLRSNVRRHPVADRPTAGTTHASMRGALRSDVTGRTRERGVPRCVFMHTNEVQPAGWTTSCARETRFTLGSLMST